MMHNVFIIDVIVYVAIIRGIINVQMSYNLMR